MPVLQKKIKKIDMFFFRIFLISVLIIDKAINSGASYSNLGPPTRGCTLSTLCRLDWSLIPVTSTTSKSLNWSLTCKHRVWLSVVYTLITTGLNKYHIFTTYTSLWEENLNRHQYQMAKSIQLIILFFKIDFRPIFKGKICGMKRIFKPWWPIIISISLRRASTCHHKFLSTNIIQHLTFEMQLMAWGKIVFLVSFIVYLFQRSRFWLSGLGPLMLQNLYHFTFQY